MITGHMIPATPYRLSPTLFVLAVTGWYLHTAVTGMANFNIRQIADTSVINQTPVISDTGLVAWNTFRPRRPGEDPGGSHIAIYQNGQRTLITEGVVDTAHDPRVSGNQVVWMSNIPHRRGGPTWVLRDPPLDPDIPEQDARWRPEQIPVTPGDPGTLMTQRVTHVTGQDFPIFEPPASPDEQQSPRRSPTGDNEIMYWDGAETVRLTMDNRNDLGAVIDGNMIAWQKARGWPFGWEIMLWADGERMQLTTNRFYDMGPQIHNGQVVWYGWDGTDYEIFRYDHATREITQITDTIYNDMSPRIWDGVIVWEGYPTANADIFMWRDGEIIQLSDNVDDDINPRIWNGQVVWQGFDGEFFQIYHFNGSTTVRLTHTSYDNVNPDIRDGLIVWQGYVDNFESEIFVWTGGPEPIRLTENEFEDYHVRTAGGRIIWRADVNGESHIYLAEPR